ncbi:hypothetical protein ACTM9N_06705 [Lachnospiraceae bacterium HCP1S3_A8]
MRFIDPGNGIPMRMFPYSPINDSAAELYDVRCTFDEEHHEWIYVISIPEKDMAAQWLRGENNRKKCILGDKRWIEPKKYGKISIRNKALKSGADGE